jgi:hypothetical protein
VVSHAAVACGVADLALIPAVKLRMSEVSQYITTKLAEMRRQQFHYDEDSRHDLRGSPHALILMAETAIPDDVEELIENDMKLPDKERVIRLEFEELEEISRYIQNGRRVYGQTPDALRTGGLKIVSRVLQSEIKKMGRSSVLANRDAKVESTDEFKVFTMNSVTSCGPRAEQRRHRIRSPSYRLAVDNALAGYTDFMISQWLTEFVLVPLQLVVWPASASRRNFWKSVLDSTGQPLFGRL